MWQKLGHQYKSHYLVKAPTNMFYQTIYSNQCQTTLLVANMPAWPMLKMFKYNY